MLKQFSKFLYDYLGVIRYLFIIKLPQKIAKSQNMFVLYFKHWLNDLVWLYYDFGIKHV